MAVTDDQVRAYFESLPPGTSDAKIAADMNTYGVPVSQVARVTGLSGAETQQRYEAAFNPSAAEIQSYAAAGPSSNVPTPAGTTGASVPADMARYLASGAARYGVTGDEIATAMGYTPTQATGAFQAAESYKSVYTPEDIQNIRNFFQQNQGMSDSEIVANMISYGVSPLAISQATGLSPDEVNTRYEAVMSRLRPTAAPVTPGTTPTIPITPGVTPGTYPIGTDINEQGVYEAPESGVLIHRGLTPGNVDNVTVMATPEIATGVIPQMPTQMINPAPIQAGGALIPEYTDIPPGVNPLSVPQINVRNLINQGVVPNYVAKPVDTSSTQFSPIFTIGNRIF